LVRGFRAQIEIKFVELGTETADQFEVISILILDNLSGVCYISNVHDGGFDALIRKNKKTKNNLEIDRWEVYDVMQRIHSTPLYTITSKLYLQK